MQAIITKYLSATNTKPSRVKATCERGSITVAFDHTGGVEHAHCYAANALCEKFVGEDAIGYGTPPTKNPWAGPRLSGCIPSGDYVHVFTPQVSKLWLCAGAFLDQTSVKNRAALRDALRSM